MPRSAAAWRSAWWTTAATSTRASSNYQPQPSNDLPDGEAGWHDAVTGAPCSPGDLDWHWHFPVVKLTDVLHPGRRYDASIYAVDGAITDASGINLQTTPVIHQFTFRTSTWPALDDHLAAYLERGALDEISPQASFGQIAAALGSAARVTDDVLLAKTMTEWLGLARREPATQPELVRVWQRTPGGEQLVGLHSRRTGTAAASGRWRTSRSQTAANVPVPTVLLQGTSGTRTLVLFRDGASGLKAIAPEDLRIVATDAWIAEDGTRQVDTATRLLNVPPRPAFLDPEASAVSLIDPNLLQLIGLGSKGDQDLPDGRHLRWIFHRLLGFPRTGFRLTQATEPADHRFRRAAAGHAARQVAAHATARARHGGAPAVPIGAYRVEGRRFRRTDRRTPAARCC